MKQVQQSTARVILIATLGSEPQVVTAAFSLLRGRGVPVEEVCVVHTSSETPVIGAALDDLQAAWKGGQFPEGTRLNFCPIMDQQGSCVADVETPGAGEASLRTLYRVVYQAKQRQARVHLLIAGGRKTLSIYGMVAAQLLFDDEDCLWHLHSAGDFLRSRRLFPQPGDQVQLVSIPVMLWRQVSPVLGDLRDIEDAMQALERYQALRVNEKLEQERRFFNELLSKAERRVVQLLASEGLPDNEIAERLSLSSRTVEQHLRSAYRKASAFWDLEEVNRSMLVTLLHLHCTLSPYPEEN